MELISLRSASKSVALRFFSPRNHLEFWRCLVSKQEKGGKAATDAQLRLYSQILPNGFLNYGFFEDPDIAPEDMSLNQIRDAQIHYARNILDLVGENNGPILDAGCGMGGLAAAAVARGFKVTALTPNRAQAEFIRKTYPEIPLFQEKLEKFSGTDKFGTVITSESFQYMKIVPAIEKIGSVLREGGNWILCDYFRTSEMGGSGHSWEEFEAKTKAQGWRIVSSRDISRNVLPTLRYVQMWGRRVAIPLIELGYDRLKRKHPAGYHLLRDVLEDLESKLMVNMRRVDPDVFMRERKYMLLKLTRN